MIWSKSFHINWATSILEALGSGAHGGLAGALGGLTRGLFDPRGSF